MNNIIYLDNAATTFPKPDNVIKEVRRCLTEYCGNPGRSAHPLSEKSAERIYECREKLCAFFNLGQAENAVFSFNTTYALNTVLNALLSYGDHVITSNAEHNSVLRPLAQLSRSKRVSVSYIDAFTTQNDILRQIKNAINPKTKAVVLTYCSNICPLVLPITQVGAICKQYKLHFIVDAAQGAGVYDIDAKRDGIFALCIPSHKSLYGIQGAGAVCFGEGCNVSELKSVFSGGNGIESKKDTMPEFLPERFEAGTLCTPAIVSLAEGIRFVERTGIEKIRETECSLSQMLTEELIKTKKAVVYGNGFSPCVLFNIRGKDCEYVGRYLASLGICVRSGFHCSPLAHKRLGTYESGAVRASFGCFNTERDVAALVKAIKEL